MPGGRTTVEQPPLGTRRGRSRDDLVDDGLPGIADLAWQDEIRPQIDEQRPVDDAEDVGRRAFAEDDLVAPSPVAPIAQLEDGTGRDQLSPSGRVTSANAPLIGSRHKRSATKIGRQRRSGTSRKVTCGSAGDVGAVELGMWAQGTGVTTHESSD